MYPTPTEHVQTVDSVMLYIVVISAILLIGITATMIIFVFKYHRKKGHKPVDIPSNIVLETVWIVIPTLLVLSMFYYGYEGFKEIRDVPDDAFTVNVTARMWQWEFKYENGKTTDTLYVPLGKPILLKMESLDVNHSLYIPSFRIKEDVIAGQVNHLYFNPDVVGSYIITCAEYCGLKHSMMYSKVVVMDDDKFYAWYNADNPKLNLAQ